MYLHHDKVHNQNYITQQKYCQYISQVFVANSQNIGCRFRHPIQANTILNRVVTPHIDKRWHVMLPAIDQQYESENILVEADSFYLADVFDNILKNGIEAVKRKKNTGKILISAECEHEWVVIKFKDDGEGISKKDIRNV